MLKFIKRIIFYTIAGIFIFIGLYFIYPDVSKLRTENPGKTSFMKYRENEWRKKGIEKTIKQTRVPLSKISPYVVNAVVISEDGNFWSHHGFDFGALREAMQRNMKKKQLRYGASTITQQLVKNLYLSPSKNPVRKIKEAIITWRIEKSLSKKRIMELYLNVIEWGDGIYGIEAAARQYYGKSAASLSPKEAAKLAAVIPNPRRYKVLGSSRYIEKRTAIIYSRMVRQGVVVDQIDETPKEMPDISEQQEDESNVEKENNIPADIEPDKVKPENSNKPLIENENKPGK